MRSDRSTARNAVGRLFHRPGGNGGRRRQEHDSAVIDLKAPLDVNVGHVLRNLVAGGTTLVTARTWLQPLVTLAPLIVCGHHQASVSPKGALSMGIWSLLDVVRCVRLFLVASDYDDKATFIKAEALRVLRHLTVSEATFDVLCKALIPPLVVKSLDIVLDNKVERLQALRLMRRCATVAPHKFPIEFMYCILAVANDGVHERDNFTKACTATVAELCVANPPLWLAAGAFMTIVRAVIGGGESCGSASVFSGSSGFAATPGGVAVNDPRAAESLILMLVYLLNEPRTRRLVNNAELVLEYLVSPFSDRHVGSSSAHAGGLGPADVTSGSMGDHGAYYQNNRQFNFYHNRFNQGYLCNRLPQHNSHQQQQQAERGEARVRMARVALCVLLRSWPGLVYFCNARSGLTKLIELLRLRDVETRRLVMGLFFDLFCLQTPEWTADFRIALLAADEKTSLQGGWLLYDGFVAAEGIDLLSPLACSINLAACYVGLLLQAMVVHGLLDAVAEATVAADVHVSIHATLLLAQLLHLCSRLFPADAVHVCHLLPTLIDATMSSDMATRLKAVSVVNRLAYIEQFKCSALGVPASLNLELLLSFCERVRPRSAGSNVACSSLSSLEGVAARRVRCGRRHYPASDTASVLTSENDDNILEADNDEVNDDITEASSSSSDGESNESSNENGRYAECQGGEEGQASGVLLVSSKSMSSSVMNASASFDANVHSRLGNERYSATVSVKRSASLNSAAALVSLVGVADNRSGDSPSGGGPLSGTFRRRRLLRIASNRQQQPAARASRITRVGSLKSSASLANLFHSSGVLLAPRVHATFPAQTGALSSFSSPSQQQVPQQQRQQQQVQQSPSSLIVSAPHGFDWDVIKCLLKQKGFERHRQAPEFLERLVSFYMPSNRLFSAIEAEREQARAMCATLLSLADFFVERQPFNPLFDQLVGDLAGCLRQIELGATNGLFSVSKLHNPSLSGDNCFSKPDTCVRSNVSSASNTGTIPPNSVLSPAKASSTLSQAYFLLIGRLTASVAGMRVLKRAAIFERLTGLLSGNAPGSGASAQQPISGPGSNSGISCHQSMAALSCYSDVYIKLALSPLNYTRPGPCRRLFAHVISESNGRSETARIYCVYLLRVLLRCRVADMSRWVVRLLILCCRQPFTYSNTLTNVSRPPVAANSIDGVVSNMKDAAVSGPSATTVRSREHSQVQGKLIDCGDEIFCSTGVALRVSAYEALNEACDVVENLDTLIAVDTELTVCGCDNDNISGAECKDYAWMLLLRYFSRPEGIAVLERRKILNSEISRWLTCGSFKYVRWVEDTLSQSLSRHRPTSDGRFSRRTGGSGSESSLGRLKAAYCPPHLFGQLVVHKQGMDIIHSQQLILPVADTIKACSIETATGVLHVKAALWAAGHACRSSEGLRLVNKHGILGKVVDLARSSGVLSVRGTAFYCLCLASVTSEGCELLSGLGWEGVRQNASSIITNKLFGGGAASCNEAIGLGGLLNVTNPAATNSDEKLQSDSAGSRWSIGDDSSWVSSSVSECRERSTADACDFASLDMTVVAETTERAPFLDKVATRVENQAGISGEKQVNFTATRKPQDTEVFSSSLVDAPLKCEPTSAVSQTERQKTAPTLISAHVVSPFSCAAAYRDGSKHGVGARLTATGPCTQKGLPDTSLTSSLLRTTTSALTLTTTNKCSDVWQQSSIDQHLPCGISYGVLGKDVAARRRTLVSPAPSKQDTVSDSLSKTGEGAVLRGACALKSDYCAYDRSALSTGHAILRTLRPKRRYRSSGEPVCPDDKPYPSLKAALVGTVPSVSIGLVLPQDLASIFNKEFVIPLISPRSSVLSCEPHSLHDSFGAVHRRETCLRCSEVYTDNEETYPLALGSSSHSGCSSEITAKDRQQARNDLLRYVVNLAAVYPNSNRAIEQLLLSMKQKQPWVFSDLCLFSDMCHLLRIFQLRQPFRKFLQELFMDVDFAILRQRAESIVRRATAMPLHATETIREVEEEFTAKSVTSESSTL